MCTAFLSLVMLEQVYQILNNFADIKNLNNYYLFILLCIFKYSYNPLLFPLIKYYYTILDRLDFIIFKSIYYFPAKHIVRSTKKCRYTYYTYS